MPSAVPRRHLELHIGHAELHAAEALAGAKQRMRLPHGQVTSTNSLCSLKENRVPSSGFFTAASRRTRASRFGITRPV